MRKSQTRCKLSQIDPPTEFKWAAFYETTADGQANQALTREIKDRVRAEDERKRAEMELKRQAQELARSNAELESFASIACHELKEPLRSIATYVQLLLSRYRGQFDKDADTFLDFVADAAKRSQRLIDDLFAYSQVVGEPPEIELVDVNMLLRQVLNNLKVMIDESRATVSYDPLPSVLADSTQLSLVFQNLLNNAIKFRSAANPIVHISAKRRENDWVFSVSDNGIGIDLSNNANVNRMFRIFHRLHPVGAYPGSGIGLAISKKIIERHGGTIWVESKPEEGSTFYFAIPHNGNNAICPIG
ncbi:MAG: GHKL domain-containing protein [Deltaproteobacteria bacterium]|nr:GHKL domain-containing protein [Deltaproteobacteria bacterium]